MEVAADMVDSHYFIRFNTEAVLDHPRISVIRIHGNGSGESSNGMGGSIDPSSIFVEYIR